MSEKKVALSAGHTLKTAGKRTPPIKELGNRVIHEHEFNRACLNKIMQGLSRCGIDYLNVTPDSNDTNEDLYGRVRRANEANCDIFVAVHYNAFDSEFDDNPNNDPCGYETFHFYSSVDGVKLASSVHKYLGLAAPYTQKDRGIKQAGFYVIKYTNMPAILTESGFMDNKREALWMIDDEFIRQKAEAHVHGICDYLGVTYKPPYDNRWEDEKVEVNSWALSNNISDCTRLDEPITRQEALAMLHRYDKLNA